MDRAFRDGLIKRLRSECFDHYLQWTEQTRLPPWLLFAIMQQDSAWRRARVLTENGAEELRIFPGARLVRRGNETVALGKRAFDVLLALAQRRGEVVDNRHLLSQCWQGLQVDETNLRIAINALRKALGATADGGGVINVPGRGYLLGLPASIEPQDAAPSDDATVTLQPSPTTRPLNRIIGRLADVDRIREQLLSRHFVTVTGPGGIGKTTIIEPVLGSLGGVTVNYLDLAPLGDRDLILATLATQLRLSESADTMCVFDALGSAGGILVIDNCEHLIDATSRLAEQIYATLPDLMILATSREPLRAAGETIYTLPPLAYPDRDDPELAGRSTEFSAMQLFMARATAAQADFAPSASDLRLIAHLCQRLDGLPLAIELAAARLDGCSLQDLAALLDDRFSILTKGRRTALPRHKTLRATVDWSHALLSPEEQAVFRSISVFPGRFDLASAEFVTSGLPIGRELVAGILTDLEAKSMVVVVASHHGPAYRLLETMRAYAVEALAESGEAENIQARLAVRVAEILKLRAAERLPTDFPVALLDTVRVALVWSFSPCGDETLGFELACAALPYLFERGLMGECQAWASRVVSKAAAESIGPSLALDPLRFLGISTMFLKGNVDEAEQALSEAMHLATELGDRARREWIGDGLYKFHIRTASYAEAMSLAQENFASGLESPSGVWKIGVSHHFAGHHLPSVDVIEKCLLTLETGDRSDLKRNGIDRRIHILSALARSRWAVGEAGEALRVARQAIEEAIALDHPVSLSIALVWCAPVFLWAGSLAEATRGADRLVECGERYALEPYRVIGQAYRAVLLTIDGRAREGLAALQSCVEALLLANHRMSQPYLAGHASEALAQIGRLEEGLGLITDSITSVRAQGCAVYLPQLLLIQAKLLQSLHGGRSGVAEAAADKARRLALHQGAALYARQAKSALAALRSGEPVGAILYSTKDVVAGAEG